VALDARDSTRFARLPFIAYPHASSTALLIASLLENSMYQLAIFNVKLIGISRQKERNKGQLSMI